MAWSAKELAISCLAGATHFSGLAGPVRRLTRSKIPILTYHSVSTPEGDAVLLRSDQDESYAARIPKADGICREALQYCNA